jgi:hypothetical protein
MSLENFNVTDYINMYGPEDVFAVTPQTFDNNPFGVQTTYTAQQNNTPMDQLFSVVGNQMHTLANKNGIKDEAFLDIDDMGFLSMSPSPVPQQVAQQTTPQEVFNQMQMMQLQQKMQEQQRQQQIIYQNMRFTQGSVNSFQMPQQMTQQQYQQQQQFFTAQPQVSFQQVAPQQHVQQSQGIQQGHVFERSPLSPPSNLIRLVEGFNTIVKDKQLGGKDNSKHPLPRQVIELTYSKLPPNSDPEALTVRASVLGYDRLSRTRSILGNLSEKRFVEAGSGPMKRWLAIFDDIVIQFSSHNNGQKLAIRFQLLDANMKPVCYVDSHEFETITKRGLEKIKERQKRKRSDDDDYSAMVENVDPGIGPIQGGQLVKVQGRGFVCPPVSQAVVKFGDRHVREIHSIRRNNIVCETPEGEAGVVDVQVSLGGSPSGKEKFLPTNAQYQYVDPTNTDSVQLMVRYIMHQNNKPSHDDESDSDRSRSPFESPGNGRRDSTSSNSGGASFYQNGNYNNLSNTMSTWMSGAERDSCGFNILHHACAHGMMELTQFLVESMIVQKIRPITDEEDDERWSKERFSQWLDAVDHYGRTPLFWALWSGSWQIAIYLVTRGANIAHQDEVRDTILHVALSQDSQCTTEALTRFLFWYMKSDDKHCTRALQLQTLITSVRNNYGTTVAELASTKESIANLLTAVNIICEKKLELTTMPVRDIVFRSGLFNGKRMSELLHQLSPEKHSENISVDMTLRRLKNEMVITTRFIDNESDDGDNDVCIRVRFDTKDLAFVILSTSQQRAEFTLLGGSRAEIYDDISEQWRSFDNENFMSSLSSFHLETSADAEQDLRRLNDYLVDLDQLYQFQDMCFCYRQPSEETHKKLPRSNSGTSNGTQEELVKMELTKTIPEPKEHKMSKMHVLRRRFGHMNMGGAKSTSPLKTEAPQTASSTNKSVVL